MKKKTILLTMALTSVLALTACTVENSDTNSSSKTDVNSEEVSKEEKIQVDKEQKSEKKDEGNTIELGKPIEFEDFILTLNDLSVSKDHYGNAALIIDYSWENTGEKNSSPFMTFSVNGYQDNVETDYAVFVDGVDLSSGQKDIRPGGKIEDGQTTVGIEDLNKTLELELKESFSFNNEKYVMEVNLSEMNK